MQGMVKIIGNETVRIRTGLSKKFFGVSSWDTKNEILMVSSYLVRIYT